MEPTASKTNTPVLEMEDVSVGSMQDQSTIVLEGVDWEVAAGDYWVLAGLQGTGKSDFLMMTAGLMPPAEGTYRLFREPMPIFDEERLPIRLRLGLVFDGGQLFNHLTVFENIALPLRYHRNLAATQAAEQTKRWMEAVELEPWAGSTPGTLGRNWQKRAGLARALILQPEILLVDNPLGGLDLRHTHWWLGLLDQLSKGHPLMGGKPVTVVVTGSDLRPWKERAKQFAILRERRFVVLGTWKQLEAASQVLLHELLLAERPT
jgi:ABC-type transporter Mla maintaining outer membrane lipid asymmetry ATPase subunit MlaF